MGGLEHCAGEGTHAGVCGAGGVGHHTVGVDGEGAAGEAPVTYTADPDTPKKGTVGQYLVWLH